MKNKITVLTLCALLFAPSVSAEAQQPGKIPRIGFMTATGDSSTPGPQVEGFRQGLKELGYIEGKNCMVEYRYETYGVGHRELVAELLQLNVDVLIVGSLPAIRAAMAATKTVPIVIVTVQDPVASGYIDSLARPGGNITGVTRLTRELSGKRLELLMEVVPRTSRVGVLWDAEGQSAGIGFKEYEAAARVLKVGLQSLGVRKPKPDFAVPFEPLSKGGRTRSS
jgi:putative ABC transport system substrate-binding protein